MKKLTKSDKLLLSVALKSSLRTEGKTFLQVEPSISYEVFKKQFSIIPLSSLKEFYCNREELLYRLIKELNIEERKKKIEKILAD